MVWIKEWITLENQRLLKLEDHDLKMGWHAYVWYGKYKEQSFCRTYSEEGAMLSMANISYTNWQENSNMGSSNTSIHFESIESEGSVTHI